MLRAAIELAIVLIAAGGLLFLISAIGMAFALIRPPRMKEAKALFFLRRLSPEDLDLPYETVNFPVRDERTGNWFQIAGWWMDCPRRSDRCVIILHGYTDAKVGGIAWAPVFRELGFNVLAIDLRAHGESQGRYTTAGFCERYDVNQVIDQLKASQVAKTRRIVLFGASLGAAVAAAAAMTRNDLAAVVMESPYVDFPSAVLSHADNLGVPGRIFQRAALWLAQKIARIDYSAVRPVDLIAHLRVPLYVIQSGDDPFVPPADQEAIAAAVAGRPHNLGVTQIWRVADSFHVMSMADQPEEFRRRMAKFLDSALGEPTAAKEISRP